MITLMQQWCYSGSRCRRLSFAAAFVLGLCLTACTGASAIDEAQRVVESTTTTSVSLPPSSTTIDIPDTPTTTISQGAVANPLHSIDADLDGALLGFSTALNTKDRAPRFRQIETDAGRRYDIGHVFHAWDKAIPTDDDLMHLDEDRLLMISWNGTDTKQIAAGAHDDWIRTQAQAVRDLQDQVLLRWLWEMDGNRRAGWVHSGADYVAAWLHIRAIFDETGADNAQFVWCPNEFLFWDGGDPDAWYPGDENVDWLCADGYNWATTVNSPEWASLTDIFGDFVAWAAPRNLPIMIGETGVAEAEPGAKAAWLREFPAMLRTELREVDAVVYFDKDFTEFGHQDWQVDTSPESYEAWLEMSNDPYMNPLGR